MSIPWELLRKSRGGERRIEAPNNVATMAFEANRHRICLLISPPQGSRYILATNPITTTDGFVLESPGIFSLNYNDHGGLVTKEWWIFNNSGVSQNFRVFFAEIPEPWLV